MNKDWLHHPFFALFTNNGHASGFDPIIGWSKDLREVTLDQADKNNGPLIPIISYDYKNHIENLSSDNGNGYTTKDLVLVQPDHFERLNEMEMKNWLHQPVETANAPLTVQPRLDKKTYLEKVSALMQHIHLGDIYEVNFCMEFYAENVSLQAFELFKTYNALSRAPMACYIKYGHLHLIGGSPERFLKRTGNALMSQPIKGTRRRSTDPLEDELLRQELQQDPKERAENIMIVDLVRNDLSRIAQRGSVKVQELCGIYAFEQVYQSISTIGCTLGTQVRFKDILHALFPMGSMTGAPKIRAMQLIEEYESTKRQWYSGSTGYILPNGDFDLNVIIRSMVYDEKNKYLSFEVGSAITAGSQPEKEYEECLVKARAMVKALNARIA